MATYSDTTFDTTRYDLARPSYPDEFYETLMKYHKSSGKTDLAIDIGCGSGFATFKLAPFFSKMVGTDISETMIKQVSSDKRAENSNIEFHVAAAEKAPSFIEAESVDLITGAECCHWVDHPTFFKESHRILKTGGTLAYWFYLDPYFVNSEKANELFTKYAYGSSKADGEPGVERYMGSYYEQPGHEYLRTALSSVEIPTELFEDIVINHYDPRKDGLGPEKTTLYIKKTINLDIWRQYVKSWSAYHSWMAENGQDHKDVAEVYADDLKREVGWGEDDQIEIIFPTIYFFMKKK